MGSPEDQPDSPVLSAAGSAQAIASGARNGAHPGRFPQKTLPQKPQAGGPAFDFADPAVIAAEARLREAAAALEVALQASLEGVPGDGGYPAAAAALEAALPPFHGCYDDWAAAVTATGNTEVTCRKGCGHCCSHYVSSVEPFEIVRLHGRIRRDPAYPSRLVAFHRRASLFRSLLEGGLREGRPDEEADDRALFRYYLRGQPCPFLSAAGECGVYEARPMSCRMFFSQSHPSLCKGKLAASPGNRNFILELPDDVEATLARASALLERFELSENLFEGLLDANARFGPYDADAP